MILSDPSPTDTRQIATCSEGGIFTVRDFYGRYTDKMAARSVILLVGIENLLLPEQWS